MVLLGYKIIISPDNPVGQYHFPIMKFIFISHFSYLYNRIKPANMTNKQPRKPIGPPKAPLLPALFTGMHAESSSIYSIVIY
jgi:hypothetical protein